MYILDFSISGGLAHVIEDKLIFKHSKLPIVNSKSLNLVLNDFFCLFEIILLDHDVLIFIPKLIVSKLPLKLFLELLLFLFFVGLANKLDNDFECLVEVALLHNEAQGVLHNPVDIHLHIFCPIVLREALLHILGDCWRHVLEKVFLGA